MKRPSVITLANENVSIVTVLRMVGVDAPDGTGRSYKIHCPFGHLYHSDGGASPAMRVFTETNSAWCFSCSVYYTPVKLAAQATDSDLVTAAARLLDRVGYKPQDPSVAWAQARDYEPDPDKALLADALKTYCRRISQRWDAQQFEPSVAATLTRCLALLDLVRSSEDVTLWLRRCKQVMGRVLMGDEPGVSDKYRVLFDTQREH